MKNLVENLKQKINNLTSLGEIVDIFCKECSADLPEKNFLFETGLYQFTCDEEYYFSLVLKYKDIEKQTPIYGVCFFIIMIF